MDIIHKDPLNDYQQLHAKHISKFFKFIWGIIRYNKFEWDGLDKVE